LQTVALKPKRAEWMLMTFGLGLLCIAMLLLPALCIPLALCVPLLGCPLVGRREEWAAWSAAVMPAVASLLAGYNALYAISLVLIGLVPLLITRLIPMPRRPGAKGMMMYISAMAVSLALTLALAAHALGGPLYATLPGVITDQISRMKDCTLILRQLAAMGLISVPDGYSLQGAARPLMDAVYNQQMLMSLRLTLEMLIRQSLPQLFVQSCLLVGLFTELRLERTKGVMLVVETKTASEKRTRVIAPPSFRLLAIPQGLRTALLLLCLVSFLTMENAAGQMLSDLAFAALSTIYMLLGAATIVFLYTKNDPDRKTLAGVIAAALFVLSPFLLLLIGVMEQFMHFRKPQADKPD